MLCSDKTDTFTQNIMIIVSKFPCVRLQSKGCCRLLPASEWTQNAKDVFDTMLFKSKQEGQVSLDRHVHLLAYRSCCQDNKIHCCGLLTQSCGDQGGRECASVLASERGVRCFGIASSDTVGKWVCLWNLTFSNPLRPDTQDIIATAGALRIQVKMITYGYASIPKETCRVIGRRTQILRPRTHQLLKPTRLIVAWESMWRVPTILSVYILSTISKLFRCGGFEWEARPRASSGARLESSIGEGSFGVFTLHELDWFTRGFDAALSFLPRRLQRWGLWCGGNGGIHHPPATDFAGGRSPNVVGDHCSGVAREKW